jgi:2'-5' RNA ligase
MATTPSLMTWLRPALGSDRDHLAAIIGGLAAQYNTPIFQPHVTMVATLMSDEDTAIGTLESLLAGVSSFDITFTEFGYEQTYFRSLYLRAKPSPQLTALYEAGRRAWKLDLPPYMPHLSLLYSNLTEEQKSPVIATVDLRLPLTIQIDAVELWADDHLGVDRWRFVGKVPLSSQTLSIATMTPSPGRLGLPALGSGESSALRPRRP